MLKVIRELLRHKAHADVQMLQAIAQHAPAARDREVLELLSHMLVANQFWVASCRDEPFTAAPADVRRCSLEELAGLYRDTHEREQAWIEAAHDGDLDRVLRSPLIPGGSCSVAEAWMQVCLHSQGHRAQCAKILRRLGGTPPMTDFIVWRITRPTPSWAWLRSSARE